MNYSGKASFALLFANSRAKPRLQQPTTWQTITKTPKAGDCLPGKTYSAYILRLNFPRQDLKQKKHNTLYPCLYELSTKLSMQQALPLFGKKDWATKGFHSLTSGKVRRQE